MFPNWLLIPLVWYLPLSLVTFINFARDKHAASRGDRRTPERALHMLELLGGFAGALLAMLLLRHKNRKPSYWLVTVLIAAAHVGVWVYLVLLWK